MDSRSVRAWPAAHSQQYDPCPSMRSSFPGAANQRMATAGAAHSGYPGSAHLPVRGLGGGGQPIPGQFARVRELRAGQDLGQHHLRARQRHPVEERLPPPATLPPHVSRGPSPAPTARLASKSPAMTASVAAHAPGPRQPGNPCSPRRHQRPGGHPGPRRSGGSGAPGWPGSQQSVVASRGRAISW